MGAREVEGERESRGGGGRDSHIKLTGMLVVSALWGVNCRFWSNLGWLGWKVTIFAHLCIALQKMPGH